MHKLTQSEIPMRPYWLTKMLVLSVVLLLEPAVAIAQGNPQQVGTIEQPADKKDAQAAPLKPKPEQERPTRWGEPTEVRVAIYVIDVDGVDSANQRFSANVYYSASWNNPLLRHKGPGPIIRRITDVWSPRLAIVNQQQAWSSFPAFVEISPDGEVTYRQKTWGWFSASMKLQGFPLDRQTLTIHMGSGRHVGIRR